MRVRPYHFHLHVGRATSHLREGRGSTHPVQEHTCHAPCPGPGPPLPPLPCPLHLSLSLGPSPGHHLVQGRHTHLPCASPALTSLSHTQVKSHVCHVTLLLSQWWPGDGPRKRGRERERCRGYGREGAEEGEGERETHDHAALNQNHFPFTHGFSPARAKPTQRGLDTRLVRTLQYSGRCGRWPTSNTGGVCT